MMCLLFEATIKFVILIDIYLENQKVPAILDYQLAQGDRSIRVVPEDQENQRDQESL